jgi:hypothetical protein
MKKDTLMWLLVAGVAWYFWSKKDEGTGLTPCAPGYVLYTDPVTGKTSCIEAPTT